MAESGGNVVAANLGRDFTAGSEALAREQEEADARVVKDYHRLLQELLGTNGSAGARRSEWPDILLPMLPAQILEVIERVHARTESEEERQRLGAMASLLDRFKGTSGTLADFEATLTVRLIVITLAYALWLGFRGEGWYWLVAPVFMAVGGLGGLMVKFVRATHWEGIRRGFVWSFALAFCELVAFSVPCGMWIRLTFVGGLGGLYDAIFVRVSVWNIILALIALVVAYHYSKGLNSLFYFLGRAPVCRHPGANERLIGAMA